MNLTRASKELFRRTPDECYPSLGVLSQHTQWQRQEALEVWQPPRTLSVRAVESDLLMLDAGNDGAFTMNDWSFGQLCRLSGVAKETVNRLSPDTASRVFSKTCRRDTSPCNCSRSAVNSARSTPPAIPGCSTPTCWP